MTLQGAIHAFPLETILQLLAVTGKTGRLDVRGDGRSGRLALSGGRLVSARLDDEDGEVALGAIFTVRRGEFEFVALDRVEERDLEGELDDLLQRALAERDRLTLIRETVPDDRMRFRLSERAADRAEIKLTAEQWRALLAIDGQRDVPAVAAVIGIRRRAALDLLAELVRAGLVDATSPEPIADESADRRLPTERSLPTTPAGEEVALVGSLPEFPLETIIQLVAATKKTGRVEVRTPSASATLGSDRGELVSATWEEEAGELALGAAFTIATGELEFVPTAAAPARNLDAPLDELLDRAAKARDRITANRALVPHERVRFKLSARATQRAEITLTSEQWRALLAVNGERDVLAVAEHLRMRRLPTMLLLADLVRAGLVDVIAPAEPPTAGPEAPWRELAWPFVDRRRAASTVEPVAPTVPEPSEAEPAEAEAPAESVPLEAAPEAAPAEAAPPPQAWEPPVGSTWAEAAAADATAEAFSTGAPAAPTQQEVEAPREPEPAAPTWEPLPAEPLTSTEEVAGAAEQALDPRLAAFGAPVAEPEAPAWQPPARETPAAAAPVAEPEPAAEGVVPTGETEVAEAPTADAAPTARPMAASTAAAVPAKRKGVFGLFDLFARVAPGAVVPTAVPPAAVAPAAMGARTRAGQLATFANELVARYNSGQYGKARVEDRMLPLLMRADEQADPIDRPIPVVNDRLDVRAIEREALAERQALPYLATLLRQIYEEAERALGRDRAKRGYRDTRDRLFGRDLSLFTAPEVAGRIPKV